MITKTPKYFFLKNLDHPITIIKLPITLPHYQDYQHHQYYQENQGPKIFFTQKFWLPYYHHYITNYITTLPQDLPLLNSWIAGVRLCGTLYRGFKRSRMSNPSNQAACLDFMLLECSFLFCKTLWTLYFNLYHLIPEVTIQVESFAGGGAAGVGLPTFAFGWPLL